MISLKYMHCYQQMKVRMTFDTSPELQRAHYSPIGYYRLDELLSVCDKLQALTARYSEHAKFIVERKQKVTEIRKVRR